MDALINASSTIILLAHFISLCLLFNRILGLSDVVNVATIFDYFQNGFIESVSDVESLQFGEKIVLLGKKRLGYNGLSLCRNKGLGLFNVKLFILFQLRLLCFSILSVLLLLLLLLSILPLSWLFLLLVSFVNFVVRSFIGSNFFVILVIIFKRLLVIFRNINVL